MSWTGRRVTSSKAGMPDGPESHSETVGHTKYVL